MSETTTELRRQVSRGNDLLTVVTTMKMLAALSIGQFEKALASLENYYRSVALGLGACWTSSVQKEPTTTSALILGSAQGLVGPFNSSLAAFTSNQLRLFPGQTKIWVSGERLETSLKHSAMNILGVFNPPSSIGAINGFIATLLLETNLLREDPSQHQFLLIYNHRIPESTTYEHRCVNILPFCRQSLLDKTLEPWPTRTIPELVGGKDAVLTGLIREFLFVSLFKACCESLAAENASRLAAMQRAEKNIEELLEDLILRSNRLRQDLIDAELFDVILSGSCESLSHTTTKS